MNKNTDFASSFLNNIKKQTQKIIFSNSKNIFTLAINFNKNYFTLYEPECLINSTDETDDLTAFGFDDDFEENLLELNNKLHNWLEKLDEGVWNDKYKYCD